MSKRTYLNELLEVAKVVISSEEECDYKTDEKCCNNRNMRWLGKVCRQNEECPYYEKERGNIDWIKQKRLKD